MQIHIIFSAKHVHDESAKLFSSDAFTIATLQRCRHQTFTDSGKDFFLGPGAGSIFFGGFGAEIILWSLARTSGVMSK